jgi:pilus assembly protein Flp/PilA
MPRNPSARRIRDQKKDVDMIRSLIRSAAAASADRKGVTAAEYAILAVGIVIVVGAAASAFSPALSGAFTAIGTQITSTQGSVAAR